MQRGFASFALVLAVVVTLTTVAGAAFLFKKALFSPKTEDMTKVLSVVETPAPTFTPEPTEDPYASWQSFQDKVFSFKYPQKWTAEDASNEKSGHLVIVKNPDKDVWIKLTDKKQVFEFGSVGAWKTSDIKINIEGKEYSTHESEVNRQGVFVDLIVPKSKNYQILFGTGYPATTGVSASLISYKASKDTILQILSTLKILE